MKATLERLPPSGRVEIAISVAADVNISATAARQKVNQFVLSEISYMMHAGEPELVIADRIAWRVPVILSLTTRGDVGVVGAAAGGLVGEVDGHLAPERRRFGGGGRPCGRVRRIRGHGRGRRAVPRDESGLRACIAEHRSVVVAAARREPEDRCDGRGASPAHQEGTSADGGEPDLVVGR